MFQPFELEKFMSLWEHDVDYNLTESGVHPVELGALMSDPTAVEELLATEAEASRADALVERAVQIVRHSQRASASMLQRRLRIGYPRAARLIDQLEELGVVGPSMGPGKEREVFVGPDDED